MGLTLKEILGNHSFKDYRLLAGYNGINRNFHAVTTFDAPDSHLWFKGKELFVTTGYLFKDDPDLLYSTIVHLHEKKTAGLGIKSGRYLNDIPKNVIEYCNKNDFPLFSIPNNVAWVDLINEINSIAMNKYILKINDPNVLASDDSYNHPEVRIKKIAKLLSEEISSDIMVYDLINQNVFTCSNKCTDCENDCSDTKYVESLWKPTFSHIKEVICDKLNIYRFTTLDKNAISEESWIIIPITIKNSTLVYFTIFEKGEKLDFYDFFAIRLSLTLIIHLFKQLYSTNIIEGIMLDEFVEEVINNKYTTFEGAYRKAKNLSINLEKKYSCIIFEQTNGNIRLFEYKDILIKKLSSFFNSSDYLFSIINGDRIVLFLKQDNVSSIKNTVLVIIKSFISIIPESNFIAGMSDKTDYLYKMGNIYIESTKALDIGRYIYPDNPIIRYSELGPFSLFRVEFFKNGKLDYSMPELEPLVNHSDKEELLHTLRVYLECNCNHNDSSKQLFVHSNTVRYRIDKIQQLCSIDLDDPIQRLKIQIMLKFI